MKSVQISMDLFRKLLLYHVGLDDSGAEEIRKELEKNWMQWCSMSYMRNIRLHLPRKNGKEPDWNIWTDVERRIASAGSLH